ncbi:MAG: RnfABCDGE type electron transport complex subunit B [Variovorax sp.]
MGAPASSEALAARLDAALPQTQCTRCGFADCADYARAIAVGEAEINRCPPGGAEGIARLARILEREDAPPLDPTCGLEGPRTMAVIDEAWCIGCTLCLDACPTDAIAGIHKRMHTVIDAHCTGCELCLPACPVDCIALQVETPQHSGWQAWSPAQAESARQRYTIHLARRHNPEHAPTDVGPEQLDATAQKRSIIEAALARARAGSSGKG